MSKYVKALSLPGIGYRHVPAPDLFAQGQAGLGRKCKQAKGVMGTFF